MLRRSGAKLGTEPNSGDVVHVTEDMAGAGYKAWNRGNNPVPGLGPYEKPFPSAGSTHVVYRGSDGKTAGFIELQTHDGKAGIMLTWVDPGSRGKGVGLKMYDWAQNNGVDLVGAVGNAGSFTAAGKAFTLKWLESR